MTKIALRYAVLTSYKGDAYKEAAVGLIFWYVLRGDDPKWLIKGQLYSSGEHHGSGIVKNKIQVYGKNWAVVASFDVHKLWYEVAHRIKTISAYACSRQIGELFLIIT